MRFLADGMLGKLTRWLRMLGHNTEYSSELEDNELLAIAEEERRILLTKDFELSQRAIAKGLKVFYVEGETEENRLSELAKRLGISLAIDLDKSRCPKCNTKLTVELKDKLKDKVHENTFAYYSDFWKCPRCQQIYWQGAHWNRIDSTLKAARKAS